MTPQATTPPASTQRSAHHASNHLAHRFAATVAAHGGRPATRVRVGDQWRVQTYRQLDRRVQRWATALVAAGVQRGDRVVIFAPNCPEWSETDLACLRIGAIPVPLYATSTPDQIRHVAGNSTASLLVAGGASEGERVRAVRGDLPDLRTVVWLTGAADGDGEVGLEEFLGGDHEAPDGDGEIAARLAAASADDLAAIIYTSGTTGDPKGVMLTHAALCAQADAIMAAFPITPDDHSLAFLPLSHALERAFTMIVLTAGCQNTYLADARKAAEMLPLAQPTLMVSVPKLYERVFAVAHEKAAASPVKKRIFDWALAVGDANQQAHREGRRPSAALRAQLALADGLVLKSIRTAIGGPKKVLSCGGAPVRLEVERFFGAIGVPMHPGYGLTEASPLVSFNSAAGFKLGTAGKIMAGGEVRIGPDSEIWYRGPNVMVGYWGDDEGTRQALGDGWLHTGDAGQLDDDGFLVITDRIKDIIVTLGGKNVAPQPIEGMILADPLFEQAILIGEGRPCLTLLVRPAAPQMQALAESLHIPWTSPGEVVANQRFVDAIKAQVAALTEKLPSHEQIRDLRLSLDEFTIDNGLLTPTLKVRRREVDKRFAALIDDMYAKLADLRKRASADQRDGH